MAILHGNTATSPRQNPHRLSAFLLCLTAALSCLVCIPSATSAPPAPPLSSGPSTASAPDWQALLQRLASPSYPERVAAQKILDQTTFPQLNTLMTLAAAADDPEVKARLAARIADLEDDHAVNPPPLGPEFHDLTLPALAGLLEKSAGIEIIPSNLGPARPFTLRPNAPFWEALNENGLEIQEYGDQRLHLCQTVDAKPRQRCLIVGPAIIAPASLERSVKLTPTVAQLARTEKLTFYYTVTLDPRIKVLRYREPWLTKVVDDAGQTLYLRPPNDIPPWTANNRVSLFFQQLSLGVAEKPATIIASAQGKMEFVAQVAAHSLEVPNVQDKLGQPLKLDGWTVVFNRLDPAVSVQVTPPPDAPKPTGWNDGSAVEISLFRGNGRYRAYHSVVAHATNGPAFSAHEPITAVLTLPTRTKTVHFTFDLKNIPLP